MSEKSEKSEKIEIEMDGKLSSKDAELMLAWWRSMLATKLKEPVKLSFSTLKPRAILVIEASTQEQAALALSALEELARERSAL